MLLGTCAFALFVTVILAWFVSAPSPAIPESRAADLERPGDAGRGRLVFHAAGCASCHATPGQQDRLRLGGGLALASLFGTFHPPNISPDPDYGIGRRRTIDLANALMRGVSPLGQHYYPALPYVDYAHMTVEDVRDLMAYLRTLQPVKDKPPAHDPAPHWVLETSLSGPISRLSGRANCSRIAIASTPPSSRKKKAVTT